MNQIAVAMAPVKPVKVLRPPRPANSRMMPKIYLPGAPLSQMEQLGHDRY